jgi:zinc D-Ala-D-Ala carboxypeptidase
MSYSEPARTAARRTRWGILAVGAIVGAVLIAVAVSPIDILPDRPGPKVGIDSDQPATADRGRPSSPDRDQPTAGAPGGLDRDRRDRQDRPTPVGVADGAVPDGVTVFDDEFPAVAKLDPALLRAVREAAKDAAADGVKFVVNSGWRSAAYQNQLLREAVAEYGSQEEAARWVATPERSLHVSGDAIDIGPSESAAWLSEHGAEYGLCQIYDNEPWHYELRPEAIDDGCPARYADPTQDPRQQQ